MTTKYPICKIIKDLEDRGLVIGDRKKAKECLRLISYYRLRPYWKIFEKHDDKTTSYTYKDNPSFDDGLRLYEFDRNLRLLVFDATEKILVAFQSSWMQCMAEKHGAHGYLNEDLYSDGKEHARQMTKLIDEFERLRKMEVAMHYQEEYSGNKWITNPARYSRKFKDACKNNKKYMKYSKSELPPVWMATNGMAFWQFSHWISNLKQASKREQIIKLYKLDKLSQDEFKSLCDELNNVRNTCAHHGLLWNKCFKEEIDIHSPWPDELSDSMNESHGNRLYNRLVLIGFLLLTISPQSKWMERMVQLVNSCCLVKPVEHMGFPEDWEELLLSLRPKPQ